MCDVVVFEFFVFFLHGGGWCGVLRCEGCVRGV